jgi:hypothetical protein
MTEIRPDPFVWSGVQLTAISGQLQFPESISRSGTGVMIFRQKNAKMLFLTQNKAKL